MLSNMNEFRKKRKLESENLFSKKRKVTSEMSTPSFNENNNEMYCKHHDQSYAKNIIIDHANIITIDCVNDDCLAEIFMYIPAFERPKIALVCQKWNRVLGYSWGRVKKLQLTHWERAGNPNCLNTFTTPNGKLSFLNSLLYKCGRYLTQLDLTAYGRSDIVPVINEYCPNLVKLRLRFIYDDDKLCWNSFSRLSKLKVLAITLQHKWYCVSVNLIDALLALADTLTDLILFYWKTHFDKPCELPTNEIVAVLRRLTTLKRFEFGGVQILPNLVQYMSDYRTAVQFYPYDHYINKNVIDPNQFMSTTTLNLMKWQITDECLYTIANTMNHIVKFSLNIEPITNDGVVAISKMNNLKYLHLSGINNSIDSSSIKLLKNLTRLALPGSNKITDDLATKVLENSPKMEKLFVLYSSITVEFIKKAAEISRNRKQPLLLAVSFLVDKKKYESPYLKIRIIQKSKKKEN